MCTGHLVKTGSTAVAVSLFPLIVALCTLTESNLKYLSSDESKKAVMVFHGLWVTHNEP